MRYAVWQVKFRENVVSWIRYKLNLPPHTKQQHCTSPSHSLVPIHRLTHTHGIRDGPETNGALFIHFFHFTFYLCWFVSFSLLFLSFFPVWVSCVFGKSTAALFLGNPAIFHSTPNHPKQQLTAHTRTISRICYEITHRITKRKASNWCRAVQQPNFHHFNCFTWKIIRRPHERRFRIW